MAKTPSAGSVYVGCKLPNGLKLMLCSEREEQETNMGGTRRFKIFRRNPTETYTLHGVALEAGQRPNFMIVAGAAITKIPAAFWEKWKEQNSDHPALASRLIFVQGDEASVRSEAKELVKLRSGLGPIDTESKDAKGKPIDPRMMGIRSVPKKDVEEDEEAMEEA